MKKFFSMDGSFTIFTVVGLIFVCSNFFISYPPLILIGLFIGHIPNTKKSIHNYKITHKLDSNLILNGLIIISLLIILLLELFIF
ncbi:MAG: hypothetical protein ACRC3Y_09310 [Romboutsia sp.]|uniref:hypothetical protein n=1 Tax=Romboutsia sp. TaxID=1965302 RepID=UPI003F34F1E2